MASDPQYPNLPSDKDGILGFLAIVLPSLLEPIFYGKTLKRNTRKVLPRLLELLEEGYTTTGCFRSLEHVVS
jgi:hypothetical protein